MHYLILKAFFEEETRHLVVGSITEIHFMIYIKAKEFVNPLFCYVSRAITYDLISWYHILFLLNFQRLESARSFPNTLTIVKTNETNN